ncbi:cysteine-rich CWC family protein [Mariniphaga anaerophila]|uniref:cysteine-rich CWC family protein n=1 Tax=Mariniphaga anaerophila TaxID=1484053 RepID=UPI0009332E25
MIKTCPVCNETFECRNDDILKCDCIEVILSKEDYEYVRSNYSDCLCKKCLINIKTERQRSPKLSAVH